MPHPSRTSGASDDVILGFRLPDRGVTELGRNTRMKARYLLNTLIGALLLLGCALAGPSQAAPGDLVANVPLSVPGYGVSVAVGCDPTIIYYTILFTDF